MPIVFLTIVICIFNIFMWVILLKKFKKIFSTEDIITSTRDELNRMIEDMNRNTGRDLNLADEKIKEIENVLLEAERRLGVLNSDLSRKSQSDEFLSSIQKNQSKYQSKIENQSFFSVSKTPTERYIQNQLNGNSQDYVQYDSDSSKDVIDYKNNTNNQNSYSEIEKSVESVKSLPDISYAQNQIVPKKDFTQSVRDLYAQGFDVEFIAKELNSTTTEVQLIIDMSF